MALVSKGEKITCTNGHVCGKLIVDVEDNAAILPAMISLQMFDDVDILPSNAGHICKLCGEQITMLDGGVYRVHTANGWIGSIPY